MTRPRLRVIDGGKAGQACRRTKDLAGFIEWFWPLYCYVPPDQWPPPEEWPFPPPRLRVAR
ncbi:MAG TPA: hypothetical protein VFQ68_39925 [Streptosporangiaceae bacterium]|nr:hypothetical protein [Streptosporangiaceae bacterium]